MSLERFCVGWERKVKAEAKAEGEGKGKGKGKAEGVLTVLDGRGLTVTAAQRKQVLAWHRPRGASPRTP